MQFHKLFKNLICHILHGLTMDYYYAEIASHHRFSWNICLFFSWLQKENLYGVLVSTWLPCVLCDMSMIDGTPLSSNVIFRDSFSMYDLNSLSHLVMLYLKTKMQWWMNCWFLLGLIVITFFLVTMFCSFDSRESSIGY